METRETVSATSSRCHDPYLRCALYGAAQVALGVRGSGVLAHSPQGCYQLVNAAFGWQGADYTETFTLCTKLCEDEIVHGGEEMLRRTILEASELRVPLLFVLSSCGPEIVGDDIEAVCEDMQAKVEFKLVPVKCAGFRGDQNDGADMALDAILKSLVTRDAPRTPGSVCLVAPHANGNPTWYGDLAWVKRMLFELGASQVLTLTHDTPVADIAHIGSAEYSLLLSHDAGQKAADYLSGHFGVKQLCRDLPFPVGFTNTRRWLAELAACFGRSDAAERIISAGENQVIEQCRRKGLEQFFMHHATSAVVADATVAIPLLRFITEDLEMITSLICLRSSLPQARTVLDSEIKSLGLGCRIIDRADVYQSKQALGGIMPQVVFGSNIERHAVEAFGIPWVFRIVNPESRFRTIDREYFGYAGMLNLIEIIENDWLDRMRSRERRYQARW